MQLASSRYRQLKWDRVRDFGIMMAIGSLVVLLAILLLVPGLALLGKWDRDPHVPPFDFYLRVLLRKLLFEVLERRRIRTGAVGCACRVGRVGQPAHESRNRLY